MQADDPAVGPMILRSALRRARSRRDSPISGGSPPIFVVVVFRAHRTAAGLGPDYVEQLKRMAGQDARSAQFSPLAGAGLGNSPRRHNLAAKQPISQSKLYEGASREGAR
jgi:hypothetical protein